jgi:hypothetical protein
VRVKTSINAGQHDLKATPKGSLQAKPSKILENDLAEVPAPAREDEDASEYENYHNPDHTY